MARDWRKVALAALAAAAVASVCALGFRVEARGPAKTDKSAAKSDDGEDGDTKSAARKKRQDPAEAQRTIESAGKLLQAGKAEQAAQTLTATLAGGNLPPAIMAKALYVRGMSYRQQGKPAQAISDLTSALWLKGGLTAEDRAEALKQRAGAYADAGVTERGQAVAAKAPEASETKERTPAKERSPVLSWGAVTTPTDNAASNSTPTSQAGGNNWFKNWFESWSAPSAQANAPPATASIDKADRTEPPRARTPRVSSAWSSTTEVNAARENGPSRGRAPSPPATTKAVGKYRVQLATVRTQREAEALAAKAKHALGALAAGEPEIDQAVLGNMGSFYRVRVGPFATVGETQAVCAKVKGSGFDCLAVTQ